VKKILLIILAIAGFIAFRQTNSVENACPLSSKIQIDAKGEVAAMKAEKAKPVSLSYDLTPFKGKIILLNLWATWCAPCKLEMPALDELNKAKGGAGFEVVAINIDTRNVERAPAFLAEAKITSLKPYADPSAKIFQELKAQNLAFGMPTSLLIGKDGCVFASLAGPAEWNSPDAHKLIESAVK
jgi:thiol-disulfide isomerase/thioredoxin